LVVSPERHAVIYFSAQFIPGHVWLSPAIRRDDAFVGVRAVVGDGPTQLKIAFVTAADHRRSLYSFSSIYITSAVLTSSLVSSNISTRPTQSVDPMRSNRARAMIFRPDTGRR